MTYEFAMNCNEIMIFPQLNIELKNTTKYIENVERLLWWSCRFIFVTNVQFGTLNEKDVRTSMNSHMASTSSKKMILLIRTTNQKNIQPKEKKHCRIQKSICVSVMHSISHRLQHFCSSFSAKTELIK